MYSDLSLYLLKNDCICKLFINFQEDIAWSALVKLFDPVQSPRCYAVIALKKQCDRSWSSLLDSLAGDLLKDHFSKHLYPVM